MQDRSASEGAAMFRHLRFQEIDRYRSLVPEARLQFTQTGPGLLNGQAMAYRSSALTLLRLRMEAPAILCSETPADLVIFAFTLSDNGEVCFNGERFEPGALAFVDGAGGYTTRGRRRDVMLAAFDRQAFKRDLAALRGDELREHASPALMEAPSSTLTLVRRTALDLLSAAGSGLARAPALERRELDLRDALLDLALPLDTGRGAGLSPRDIVAWANEVCVRKGSFSISVADLCRGVGVSRSTLHRAFWEVCGTAPSTYLSFRRMTEARRMLLGGQPERGAVKRAAIDSGHRELGRFSVEYRRIFGESPTATLNRESSD